MVYPRVGGGNTPTPSAVDRELGLSPRGRGKHHLKPDDFQGGGSIPAWAGETHPATSRAPGQTVYPRVGGGNGEWRGVYCGEEGLSPRGRGKRNGGFPAEVPLRSIPAWAGETRCIGYCLRCEWVYPRVGGGNTGGQNFIDAGHGLSPRGRGKPAAPMATLTDMRSIPAWAGETGKEADSAARAVVYPRVGGGNRLPGYQYREGSGLSPRGRGKR